MMKQITGVKIIRLTPDIDEKNIEKFLDSVMLDYPCAYAILNESDTRFLRSAFKSRLALSLDFSMFDFSNVYNLEYFCSSCQVKHINFDNADFSNCYNMKNMFGDCYYLESINFRNVKMNMDRLVNTSCMFDSCVNLQSLDLSFLRGVKLIQTYRMFSACKSLKSLNTECLRMDKVTDASAMFSHCSELKHLDVSCFNLSMVTNASHMFSRCSSLEELDISGFNMRAVEKMNFMFALCEKIRYLDTSSIKTGNVQFMSYAFSNMGLEELDLHNFDIRAVRDRNHPPFMELFNTMIIVSSRHRTWCRILREGGYKYKIVKAENNGKK